MASQTTPTPGTNGEDELDYLRGMSRDEIKDFIVSLSSLPSETGKPDPAATPSNWLNESIGAPPLWAEEFDYQKNYKFCLNCMLFTAIYSTEYKRRDDGPGEFKLKHLKEVSTLHHIEPAKLRSPYTLKDILDSAINGCPLCSMVVGTSWFEGNTPFDTARWVKNPLWRRRAQRLLFNMYRPDITLHTDGKWSGPFLQIVYGTDMKIPESSADRDRCDSWRVIHLWGPEQLKNWYDRKGCPYTLQATLGEPPLPSMSPTTRCPHVMDIAEWWIRRCLGEHTTCAIPGGQMDDSESPSRLLHIDNDKGKKKFPNLEEAKLADFMNNIDEASLPQTLQDAIIITRYLGYSYLWIDAFCIIQDSPSDWLAESVKMGSIYRKSVFTIAALGAANVYQGCFTARNPNCYRDISLSDPNLVFSARAGDVYPGFKREFEVFGPVASPLQTRAWCVQEQLLSPRTLFFGASGIFWQCLECEADEGYPQGTKGSEENLKSVVTKSLVSPGESDVRKTWRTVLQRYTGCKLTYASDKLVAISGVGRLLAKASGDEFIAGMLKQDIWRDLLWSSQETLWSQNEDLARLTNDSPSFSWASVSQPTCYSFSLQDYSKRSHMDAKSIIVENTGTGPVQQCNLRVTTQLREVVLLPPVYSKSGRPSLMLAEDVPFDHESAWSDSDVPLQVTARLQEDTTFSWHLDRDIDKDKDTSRLGHFAYYWIPDISLLDGKITRAWHMCLVRQEGYYPAGSMGLIVIPVDEEKKTWKRIGFCLHTGFAESWKEGMELRFTVQNDTTKEIDWEETAKLRAPNPFLLDKEKPCVEIILV
ncbi:uncharacterized protein ALTATR162_LOCUS2983 [Alternaria atra]|uniref:Heterokaryon incompatibility domain-containing protein n=1 Tax=Alternaria atra TaxID=119953 RepID=A0A8J2N3I3_9PLEO|nr:uncharacterized protein ALTATR162_LOCUS2983 [Alternaria atra]CAG5152967.1 unnamed protein product [Alternaria atra]